MGKTSAQPSAVQELQLPEPGTYTIDPVHSSVGFVARHMMISKVRGRFREIYGTLVVLEEIELSYVEVTIDAASIDTGDPERDRHLRSRDFLDVERYPEIRFRSTSVRKGTGERWDVEGDLTIRGVSRPVRLDVEFTGGAIDPWGQMRIAFRATTEINREDFDITWNQALEAGGLLVSKDIRIEIDIEAVRVEDEVIPAG